MGRWEGRVGVTDSAWGRGQLPGGGGDLGRQFGIILGMVREPER